MHAYDLFFKLYCAQHFGQTVIGQSKAVMVALDKAKKTLFFSMGPIERFKMKAGEGKSCGPEKLQPYQALNRRMMKGKGRGAGN